MALIFLSLFLILLGAASVKAYEWWQPKRKERKQVARGLVPDRMLPPELREDAFSPNAKPRASYARRMDPEAWQSRQTKIKEYRMNNPEAR